MKLIFHLLLTMITTDPTSIQARFMDGWNGLSITSFRWRLFAIAPNSSQAWRCEFIYELLTVKKPSSKSRRPCLVWQNRHGNKELWASYWFHVLIESLFGLVEGAFCTCFFMFIHKFLVIAISIGRETGTSICVLGTTLRPLLSHHCAF